MATRVLLHLGDATNKCIFANVQCYRTKFQVQNVLKQSRNFRRVRQVEESPKSPFDNVVVEYTGTANNKKILKSFLFASTFTGATLVGATILEYERIRSQTFKRFNRFGFGQPIKASDNDSSLDIEYFLYLYSWKVAEWRSEANAWWTSLSEGQRMFYFICFANVLVFLAWRVPQWKPVMFKYFATNPASNATYSPMLLSMFSHYSLWHLAANMYVLHSFSGAAVAYLGREHFLAVYLSSGVFSSAFSNAYKIILNRPGFSLGASGAIMGILGFVCTQFPETRLSIIMLPQFTFSAGAAIKSIMAFDAAGCIMNWQFFDHAAHLGGVLFGICWQKWGVEHVWRKRSPILTRWHEYRNPSKSQ